MKILLISIFTLNSSLITFESIDNYSNCQSKIEYFYNKKSLTNVYYEGFCLQVEEGMMMPSNIESRLSDYLKRLDYDIMNHESVIGFNRDKKTLKIYPNIDDCEETLDSCGYSFQEIIYKKALNK